PHRPPPQARHTRQRPRLSPVEQVRFVQGRMRRQAWERIGYGLYVPTAGDPEAHLHALASQLHKGGGFTHVTAPRMRRWWLPPLPLGVPEFAAQNNRNRPRRPQLRIIRTTPEPEVTRLRGLPVVSSMDVLLALARDFALLDMVVMLDAALHLGDLTRRDLQEGLCARRHGVRRLREAAS